MSNSMQNSGKRKCAAHKLLELLERHLNACDDWEEHWHTASLGKFKGDEERENHSRISIEHTKPLIAEARASGFGYAVLVDIIPGAFKSSADERHAILEDLVSYAEDKYGVDY
jgi:hypothetical protein